MHPFVFGSEVTPLYDPMISKLSVWGEDRDQALARLDRALAEYKVIGVTTNISFLRRVLAEPTFQSGDFDTGFIGDVIQGSSEPDAQYETIAMLAAVMDAFERDEAAEAAFQPQGALSDNGNAWRRYQLLGGRS